MPADETTLLRGDEEATAEAFVFLETSEHIAQNWKHILILGILNIITGIGCLFFPVFATQVAELFLVSLIFSMGLLNVLAVCASSETGSSAYQQSPIFWVGFCQILLAILMYTNPFFTLTILTFLIAVTFMLLGSIQIALARRYRERMAARALMMLSGALAVLMSIIIILFMPTAKWYTIGVLLGVNLVNIGTNRVVIGLFGKKIAESDDTTVESWRSYLDADIV